MVRTARCACQLFPDFGCVPFFWSEGCGATGPPVEEVGPVVCFGCDPVQSLRVSFLGRPRFFGGGGMIGAFARMCSGMRSAWARKR